MYKEYALWIMGNVSVINWKRKWTFWKCSKWSTNNRLYNSYLVIFVYLYSYIYYIYTYRGFVVLSAIRKDKQKCSGRLNQTVRRDCKTKRSDETNRCEILQCRPERCIPPGYVLAYRLASPLKRLVVEPFRLQRNINVYIYIYTYSIWNIQEYKMWKNELWELYI